MAADVGTTLASWSTTESSNAPAGTTPLSTNLDDNLRMIQAVVRQLASDSTIASATTTDLSTIPGTFITVSGTTTITGLGTVSAGIYKWLIFSGALTLTHNATSLILPGAVNITTADGTVVLVKSLGSGNWRCLYASNASGSSSQSFAMLDGTVAGTLDVTGVSTLTGGIAVEARVSPTLLNSWINVGGANKTAGYWKDSFGVVHLEGYVRDGTAEAIFELPVGYRPSATTRFIAYNGGAAASQVYIASLGGVYSSSFGAGILISLDGITFRTN